MLATQPSERAVVVAIQRYLKSLPRCWSFKTHGGPMQVAGLPDILGVCQDVAFGLEIKRPGGKATPLQLATLRRIEEAGGKAAVVTSADEVRALFELWGMA